MTDTPVRPATAEDLPAIGRIWYEAQTDDDPDPPPLRAVPSLYAHELAHNELLVAERDGQVAAFGSLITRGPLRFLADLFVTRALHGAGLGRLLLDRLIPADDGL